MNSDYRQTNTFDSDDNSIEVSALPSVFQRVGLPVVKAFPNHWLIHLLTARRQICIVVYAIFSDVISVLFASTEIHCLYCLPRCVICAVNKYWDPCLCCYNRTDGSFSCCRLEDVLFMSLQASRCVVCAPLQTPRRVVYVSLQTPICVIYVPLQTPRCVVYVPLQTPRCVVYVPLQAPRCIVYAPLPWLQAPRRTTSTADTTPR